MNRTKYTDARIIISEDFWSSIDKDGNGLDANEFHNAVRAFDNGSIYGIPFLVYPVIKTENLKDFRAVYQSEIDATQTSFAVVPTLTSSMPYSQKSWQSWYDVTSKTFGLSFSSVDVKSQKSSLASLQVKDLPETFNYVIPVATVAKKKIMLDKHIQLSDRVFFQTPRTELHAICSRRKSKYVPRNSFLMSRMCSTHRKQV